MSWWRQGSVHNKQLPGQYYSHCHQLIKQFVGWNESPLLPWVIISLLTRLRAQYTGQPFIATSVLLVVVFISFVIYNNRYYSTITQLTSIIVYRLLSIIYLTSVIIGFEQKTCESFYKTKLLLSPNDLLHAWEFRLIKYVVDYQTCQKLFPMTAYSNHWII